MMILFEFNSCFKGYLISLIEYKQSLGFKYEVEQKRLREFDRFVTKKNIQSVELTHSLVEEFCALRPNEQLTNRNTRVSCIRNLAKHLITFGIDAYICPPLPKGAYNRIFIPYHWSCIKIYKILTNTDYF